MNKKTINKINYEEIIGLIRNELVEVMNASYNVYKDYEIILSSEQQFIKTEELNPKAIYIVIKFGSATVTFGQSILPATITAMGEENRLNVARMLLSDFAETYNLVRAYDNTIQQVLEAPDVLSNFNVAQTGFRNLLSVDAVFVVSKNANFYTIYDFDYKVENATNIEKFYFTDNGNKFFKKVFTGTTDLESFGENIHSYTFRYNANNENHYSLQIDDAFVKIIDPNDYNLTTETLANSHSFTITLKTLQQLPTITTSFGEDADLDVQAFYFKKNFSESIVRLGTLVYSFTCFLLDNYALFNTVVDIVTKDTDACPEGVNKTFKMAIAFKNGKVLVDDFKLVNFVSEQQLGEIPVASFTFAN